ncbi:hypothetical protein G6F37_004481 [Rhizopus arrhizus]|nr:hypothetical protein G6F38_004635 [Rhizopus arrhizus]KAG1159894.1 hypothetical protein G6F37_004481 [Rhizopus arrhizus]
MVNSQATTTLKYSREDNTLLESVENNAKLYHRRQAPISLEIDTSLSKTNAFFNTNDTAIPRPPPSISRKISIKQNNTIPVVQEKNHENYASRLRNLVAATRQVSVAPTPIPQYLNVKKSVLSEELRSPTFSEVEIMPLPTPKPTNSRERKLPEATKSEEIAIISYLHSSYSKEMPKLSDEPILGDYIEQPIKREQQNYNQMIHVMDEDVIGKQIGSYRISKLLGVGAFSKVYIGHHTKTEQFCALKIIQKGKLLNDPRIRSSIEREIGVLKYIYHTNIVRLEATMETEQFICIVLEYVEGGELFDLVQKMHYQSRLARQKVDETTIKNLFLQLVKAVKWLHEHHIVHRDLKLENILIHKEDEQIVLKITDFGLARVVDPESPLLTTRCGSEEYAAPEILQGKGYDGKKTDTWALGIILYALLVGYLPFRYDIRATQLGQQATRSISDMANNASKSSNGNFNSPILGNLSEECAKAARILEQFIIKEEMENGFDTIIPVSVIKEAKGLAIFTVVKAGFLWSGRAGSGIVVSRLPDGRWSAPTAIATGGVGFGAQIGADITDFVLILNSEEAVRAFSQGGNLTLGGNLSVSAGPIGAGSEASIAGDIRQKKVAPVFSYTKSKGLFAGMSIEGTGLLELQKANSKFYGRPIRAEALLKGQIEPPSEAKVLYDTIQRAENRDPY